MEPTNYYHIFLCFFFCYAFSVLPVSIVFLTEAKRVGFSVELIHHDSPKSPFYNPKLTPYEKVFNAIRRSFSGVNQFNQNVAQADIINNRVSYLMNISVGSPPFPILAIADTGSDLIWTQCRPCTQCFSQKDALFDPRKSSTFRKLSCFSRQCKALERSSCSNDQTCLYSVSYGDTSFSNGDLAMDTVTLGSTSGPPVPLTKTVIGCGHKNAGTFNDKTSGIVGLGGSEVSLVTQLGDSIGGKFSYCLTPFSFSLSKNNTSSKLNFGTNGVVSGSSVVSTPLISKELNTFYYLTLEAISVGAKKIRFVDSSSSKGNIIIDSGTTLTFFPKLFNSKLIPALSDAIDAKAVKDPNGLLDLCYNFRTDFQVRIPDITVHFTGADVKLSPLNTFIRVTQEIVCFTFKGSGGAHSIYGNFAQTNFLVGYDRQKKTLSFKPTDCTKA
ncbi:aspartic proteinase CDR1-like [Mangifera indica]|uniref:aspartic proteinase CDR1-like n=1 Tax=Mangifera indica TaxID=29780 RepID=UPI001CFB53DA|nr:aspartic proteinase CDR1-like [Mangifera indica]